MISQSLQELKEQITNARIFVPKALILLETGFREISLTTLAQWHSTGLSSDKLFHTLASLNHPSWGTWNGLFNDLKNARKEILRNGTPEDRQKVQSAHSLEDILQSREKRVSEELIHQLRTSCKKHLRYEFSEKTRLKQLLELPIAIRNIMVHQAPDDDAWWQWAQETIQLITPYFERNNFLEPTGPDFPLPWFKTIDDIRYSYNGISNQHEAIYAAPTAPVQYDREQGGKTLEIFKDILGQSALHTKGFEDLMNQASPQESHGILLNEYLLLKPIGEGGFATVYQAIQLSTDRKVAVKILKDGMDEDIKERFRNEAKHLASFYENENIVDVINFGESSWRKPPETHQDKLPWFAQFSNGAPVKDFIAMEWVDGITLNEAYKKQQSSQYYTLKQLTQFFNQAAKALSAIHANGLIHRDIKPDNIMLDTKGTVKIMDFGIARSDDEDRTFRTLTGIQPGTPAYMSPEQLRAKDAEAEVGKATDIYSLGATFYELFTSTRLYNHDSESAVDVNTKKLNHTAPRPPRSINHKLPWEIATLLEGCLQREIADRIESASALEKDIERFLSNDIIRYKKPSFLRQTELSYKRNKNIFYLCGMFILIIASGICFHILNITEKNKKLFTALKKNKRQQLTLETTNVSLKEQKQLTEKYAKQLEIVINKRDDLHAAIEKNKASTNQSWNLHLKDTCDSVLNSITTAGNYMIDSSKTTTTEGVAEALHHFQEAKKRALETKDQIYSQYFNSNEDK